MLRAAIDTNVLVSGLIGGRTGSEVLAAIHGGSFQLLSSQPLLNEAAEVLQRSKFNLTKEEISEFINVMALAGSVVRPIRRIRACRDHKDDVILECAVAGKATHIVTGDGDLLDMGSFEGVDIVTPSVFLALLPGRRP